LAWPSAGGEVPLAAAHVAARAESERVLVVVRDDVARILARHLPERGELVVSRADDALGPAGSIAAAAPRVDEDAIALVTPVDCPPASDGVVRALLDAMGEAGALAARPCHAGRRGHPVALAGSVLARYRDEALPLRAVLAALGARVRDVEVDDPAVLDDLDTPADLGRAPRFFWV
jgi:CTP:molybdopterin cytidylyltransferase MocA